MNGRGEFVVTAVGDATEIGKVAKKIYRTDFGGDTASHAARQVG